MLLITKEQAIKFGLRNPSLQTIEIPKTWSLNDSRQWLKNHGYLWQYYRTTKNMRRFAQTYDIAQSHFYSIKLSNGIVMVYQKY